MDNVDIDFMKNADGVALDAVGEEIVVSSLSTDESEEVKNWEEKAEETDAPETSKDLTGDGLADYFMAEFLKGDEESDGDDEASLGRGVTLDKGHSPEGEEYSVGRWVAFPHARMTGKIRKIVDFGPSEFGDWTIYWLESPELEKSHHAKTIGLRLNGSKTFSTQAEAEKFLREEEKEYREKYKHVATEDASSTIAIFDPERFDQNSFEWGAIYWINQIRDAVEEFEDGYVVPDEQFREMLKPFKQAARVYAEAQGKDKKWVKKTVLSVPKAFERAFESKSDLDGLTKEFILKNFTVEAICALAEGSVDKVDEFIDYYARVGQYKARGGYEVGNYVVIINDPPSEHKESERIRRIIAIRGEKGDDDPTLVFWNASKSGIVERKASQCSKPFHKCDDAYDWWFVENGDGARPLKKAPAIEKDDGLSAARDILKLGGDMNVIAADAIEDVFGIGQDALDPNDADFWAKHDKAKHHGHFDPETMTCKLREKYEQGEKIENLKDEMDDLAEEGPDLSGVTPSNRQIESPEAEQPKKRGVSRVFTGSVADYSQPSLTKLGTGQGTQVYGHGLYGSTLRNDAEYYAALAQGNFVPRPGERGDQIIYEQTFFTNRDEGDESHLLSWYEPVTDENKKRIDNALEKISGNKMDWSDVHSGEDLYRKLANFASPQEASEFLANNADIDGIKYPAEDHHGRQVGTAKGWNYVSFRDDNIRIDKKYVNGQKIFDYQELMAKKFPGVDAVEVLQRISKMDSPEAMAEEFRRILRKRKTYGVPYQGSKSRIAKDIVDILPSGKRFVDLFSGGGAVTHAAMDSGKYSKFRMNDIDGRGQRLFLEGVQGKWDDYSRETMTPEEFSRIKGTPESLPWSFNGLGRQLARSNNGRNYASEQISRVKSLSTLKDRSKDVEASETDYSKVKLRPGDVVYADIPYEATDTRGYGRGSVFDKQKFEEWAQKQAVPVYVSEYQMGDGWTEISSFNVPGMRGGNRTEKLYVQSKFADSASGSRMSSAEDGLDEIAAAAVEAAFGIGEDALDPNDADFWAKHDKARHGGHFDPETMTCKLREKYEQGEKIENLKDEMDDIEGEDPDGGSSGNVGSGNVTPEEDAAYLEAVKRGDMETAEQMVRDAAHRAFPNTKAVGEDGNPILLFRGTLEEENVPRTSFEAGEGVFLTDNEEVAEQFVYPREYGELVTERYNAETDDYEDIEPGPVAKLFVNMENPLVVEGPEAQKLTDDTVAQSRFLKESREKGHDGVILKGVREGVDDPRVGDSYIALTKGSVKSAEAVCYNDDGEPVPLSARFDINSEDVRGNLASRQGGDLNSDPDYGIISEVLKAEKDRQNGRPAQFHQRVPEEALRGGDEGTRILREASLVCRATEGTGSQGEGNSGGGDGRGEGAAEGAVSGVEQAREASRRQEAILEKYAKKLGIWEDDAATALKERDDYDYIEGGETIAFFPDDTNKPLTKVITSAYFPETVQLLDRIMLHNYLFPYSKLDVKGFGRARPDWLTDGDPMFCVKVEQQPVDTSCPAKPEQIEEYMKNLGFHKHRELAGGDVVWESNDGKYVVSDLTDENVFLTQDGHIAVIDANIQLNTPDSDGSGKYKIPSFKNQESDLQKGRQDMGIVQDAQVGAVAQQQPNGQASAKPTMPEIDFAGLNKFLKEQGQNAGTQSPQPAQQAQQPQTENPDTGAEQDGFANIKDGDTFTDENGQQWQYTVMNFNVVPEDTKDEMVDDLSGTDDESEGEREPQDNEESDESESVDYDGNLARGLDIALSILREDDESDAGVAQDSALDILMSACDEVIGDSAVAQDGAYNTGKPLTMKRQREGWDTNDPSEIAAYHWKRKNVSKNADGSYHVGHYGTEANLKARENARRTHRQAVAATWEDCKAKDPYKCRWHGAAFMRDNFGKILQSNGLPVGNFDVRIDNPEKIKSLGKNEPIPYRLIFATPLDTPPEVRMKCAREFFLKHPGLVYELPKGQAVGDLSFKVKDPEDAEDMPIDAPTRGDIRDRQDTQSEASWNERANARAAVSYAGRDTLDPSTFFDMLSEHPSNIVELNEDMLRYLHSFPDCVPEGMTAEDVREVYDRFKKADAAKKGVQSYILNGEVRDKAEFLAEAAEQGLEKEAKAYYTAAQDVYDLAADIFNNVQQQLQDSYEEIHSAVRAMPSGKMVDGSTSGFKNTVYFGNGFSVKGKKFPINISGEEGEVLKECMEDYAKSYRIASALTDKIMEGCEKREPLLVAQGIAAARKHLQELQFSAETLGELQDTIIENMSEQRRKKNGIALPSAKGKKGNTEASVSGAQAKERPHKSEEPVAEAKEETGVKTSPEGTAENTEVVEKKKATKGEMLKKKDLEERAKKSETAATESGMSAEGSTAMPANGTIPKLSAEELEQIKSDARKDKNIKALDKSRIKMFQTFGADSEQFKAADKKAKDALNAFVQKKVAEMNANSPAKHAETPAETAAENPVEQQADVKRKKSQNVDESAQGQQSVAKTDEPKQEEAQQQIQEPEPVAQEPAPVQKPIVPRSKKPQSSAVKMAKGEQQQTATATSAAKKNEQAVEASGAGIDIVRGMKISDKPTLEEAKAMNEQFAALEKRLRGLTQVYSSKTSDSKDWKAAESELKAIKSEIDGLMQKARGKGYQWTKDSPKYGMEGASDRRPLDVPTNFHLSGITDESGKTVSVPYNPPTAGEMDIPESTDTQSEEGEKSTKKVAKKQTKPFKKKADYSADFDAIDDKVGVIGQGPYKEKSINDLISDGYEVKPITTNGQLEYYLGLPDDTSTYGIRISKEQPPLRLSNLFEKRMGGNLTDEQSFHDFVEALRWKIKDYKNFS